MSNENALAPGTKLKCGSSTYVINSVLGQGGFGITYRATLPVEFRGVKSKVSVAIKEHFLACDCERNGTTVSFSRPAAERVTNSCKSFESEARRLRSIRGKHINIVEVGEVFEANNTAYFVMEYLEGESLHDRVRRDGPMSELDMLSVMLPIISATAFLHGNQITHLDIKPANIMLASNWEEGEDGEVQTVRPVLIDFGLSKHYDDHGNATSSMHAAGFSNGYAPVEQYTGIQTFSPTADVYSLGATMVYCLTGETLPRATEVTTEYVDSLLPQNLSAKTRKAILHALMLHAKDRPADAGKLMSELGYRNSDLPKIDPAPARPKTKPKASSAPAETPAKTEKKPMKMWMRVVSALLGIAFIYAFFFVPCGWYSFSDLNHTQYVCLITAFKFSPFSYGFAAVCLIILFASVLSICTSFSRHILINVFSAAFVVCILCILLVNIMVESFDYSMYGDYLSCISDKGMRNTDETSFVWAYIICIIWNAFNFCTLFGDGPKKKEKVSSETVMR